VIAAKAVERAAGVGVTRRIVMPSGFHTTWVEFGPSGTDAMQGVLRFNHRTVVPPGSRHPHIDRPRVRHDKQSGETAGGAELNFELAIESISYDLASSFQQKQI
jgi:hypothetical protein